MRSEIEDNIWFGHLNDDIYEKKMTQSDTQKHSGQINSADI